jgi:hypothetical protein
MPEFTDERKKRRQELIEDGTRFLKSRHTFKTIEETKEIVYYDKDKGVYVPGGEVIIETDLEDIFEFKLTGAVITEIKGHIMRQTYVKRPHNETNLCKKAGF